MLNENLGLINITCFHIFVQVASQQRARIVDVARYKDENKITENRTLTMDSSIYSEMTLIHCRFSAFLITGRYTNLSIIILLLILILLVVLLFNQHQLEKKQ